MVRTLLQLKKIYLLSRLHKIPEKFFNVLVVALIILPFFTQVQAQNAEIGTKVIDDQTYPVAGTNQQEFTDAYIDSIFYSFTSKVTGQTEINASNTGAITSYTLKKRGFIADIGDLTGSLYLNRPVSLQPVISDFIASVNPVKRAEAQSFVFSGQGALTPIYKLWQITRNIAYVFFSVIFIIIAFVILFRQKINGQQYVTVINALPNIIIALIVVTFSYPLAGLLIDIGNVATFAIATLVIDLLPGSTEVVKQLNNAGGGGASLNIITLLMKFFEETFTSGANGEGATYLGTTIRSIMNVFSAFPLVGSVAAAGLGAILPFFLSIAIASAIFRLFIGLIMNYVEIIMKVIMSPFALIGTALSGPSTIGEWVKDMLSNILVFPGVFAGICIISIFLFTGTNGCQYTTTHEGTACVLWTAGGGGTAQGNINDTGIRYIPAPIGYYSTDVNGTPNPFILNGLVGLGLLLFLPDMIDIIKKSVKSGKGPDISGDNIKGAFRRIPVVGGFIK